MAMRLMLLRSRLLSPRKPGSDGEAERDAVAELRRLDELARMRAAARPPS